MSNILREKRAASQASQTLSAHAIQEKAMNTVTIILAAGEQKRWTEPYAKQLAIVSGMPIISRTLTQAHAYTRRTYVLTHREDIRDQVHLRGCFVTAPAKRRCIVETIEYSARWWEDRVVILLGDVYFSNPLIDTIYSCKEPLKFFGDGGELYAMTFDESKRKEVYDHIVLVKQLYSEEHEGGMLWQLYRSMCGFSLMVHQVDRKLLHFVRNDITGDVDCMGDYLALVERVEKNGHNA